MIKHILLAALAVTLLCSVTACGKTKTLHCDGCGIEVEVDADSNMDEDWTIFCKDCEEKSGLDTIVE